MTEVTKTLASNKYDVIRNGETTKVQIVPQMVSTLRLELSFWDEIAGKCTFVRYDDWILMT